VPDPRVPTPEFHALFIVLRRGEREGSGEGLRLDCVLLLEGDDTFLLKKDDLEPIKNIRSAQKERDMLNLSPGDGGFELRRPDFHPSALLDNAHSAVDALNFINGFAERIKAQIAPQLIGD